MLLGKSERSTGGRKWKDMKEFLAIMEESNVSVDPMLLDGLRMRIVTSRSGFRPTRSLANSIIGSK